MDFQSIAPVAWFLGILVSWYVFAARAGLFSHPGVDWREFIFGNPSYFVQLVGKSIVWPAVLVLWAVQGFGASPWKSTTEVDGQPVRLVYRVKSGPPTASSGVPKIFQNMPLAPIPGPTVATKTATAPVTAAPQTAQSAPRAKSSILAAIAIRFGRHEWLGRDSPENPAKISSEISVPLYKQAAADPMAFLRRLIDEALPAGGWAAFGADRLMMDLITDETVKNSEEAKTILDASLAFLRDNGVPPKSLRPYQWDHWVARGGTMDSWLPRRPTPSPDEAAITPLAPGEIRNIAKLRKEPDSNLLFVTDSDDGRVRLVIEGPTNDDDPTRTRWVWETHDTLHDAYVRVGIFEEVPTDWYAPELEPYFPLPSPKI